ncbi:hypothetical protein L1987_79575 [Smallanthus sonchifolius]|uniref:Uncharacterized protein n=1 Tax=Smallanthus sonchifolius TaxID=185202 RepID=A0ACB8ZGD8_9ASTR|nr:hypothetical protein L1987_79575 [Smallanthus sonchifolius]
MPKKNDPPPSALLPRRSTRGTSKLPSQSEGDETEILGAPHVGKVDLQEGLASTPQPLLMNTTVCDINKESSDPPPSALLPRRSTQGTSKLPSQSEGDETEILGAPHVGNVDLQEGLASTPQPLLMNTTVCVEIPPPFGVFLPQNPESAPPRAVCRDGDVEPGTQSEPPLGATEILAPAPSSVGRFEAPHLRKYTNTRRGSPYTKPERVGPIRSPGLRAARTERHHHRPVGSSSPVSKSSGFNLDAQNNPGKDSTSPVGLETSIMSGSTSDTGNREQSHPQDGQIDGGNPLQAMNVEVQKLMDCSYESRPGLQSDPIQAIQSVWNSPISDERRWALLKCKVKKKNPVRVKVSFQYDNTAHPIGSQGINGLGGKQKGAAPAASQITKPHCASSGVATGPASSKPKQVNMGFNYSRAVQGGKGSLNQLRGTPPVAANCATACPISTHAAPKNPTVNSAPHYSSMDIDTSNRFSVLDIPNSIKLSKLVEIQDDLYPPDHGMVDGMDVETTQEKRNVSEVCQLNREHSNGTRILPESILSPPKSGKSPSPVQLGPDGSGMTYGISADVDVVDQWCPGQWDYFNDMCTLMGLDPDNCIEDVESDSKNGTPHFLSAQMKVGMPSVSKSTQQSFRDKFPRVNGFCLVLAMGFGYHSDWHLGCGSLVDWALGHLVNLFFLAGDRRDGVAYAQLGSFFDPPIAPYGPKGLLLGWFGLLIEAGPSWVFIEDVECLSLGPL